MKNIEKIRDGLYVKESFDGYRVVYPYKNDDGSTNWFNIFTGGNYWKLAKLAFILFVILGVSWSYRVDTKNCREFINNPCRFLPNITAFCTETPIQDWMINLTFKEGREGEEGK